MLHSFGVICKVKSGKIGEPKPATGTTASKQSSGLFSDSDDDNAGQVFGGRSHTGSAAHGMYDCY